MRALGQRTQRLPAEVKAAAVERYLTSDLTFTAVAEQFGTSRYNVRNWVESAEGVGVAKKPKKQKSEQRPTSLAAAPTDQRTGEEKLRLLMEAGRLSENDLGEFLRREGLREGDLERFRSEALAGLAGQVHSPSDRRRILELERKNALQQKRLNEAEVLLDLQKKVHALWGAKDDDTGGS